MCLKPRLIPNVNKGNHSSLSHIKDSTSAFIPVPCGVCSVCLALKQQYIVQRVQMEALSHDLYFGTLTYNNECLPIHTVDDFKLAHVDISHWQNMIKRIRGKYDLPPFRYMVCSEYGGRRHRPHFHFLLSFPKCDLNLAERWSFSDKLHDIFLFEWRVNVEVLPGVFNKNGSPRKNTRSPKWVNLCTYKRTQKSWNFDLHYCDPWTSPNGLDDIAFYVSKYCLKYDKWVDKLKSKLFFSLQESDFAETWNKIRPRRLMSKGFGSADDSAVKEHISKGIELAMNISDAIYPYFISPVDGSTFPLAPYYSKKFLDLSQLSVFNLRKPTLTLDDMFVDSTPDLLPYEMVDKEIRFAKVCDSLEERHTYFDDDANDINDLIISNLYGTDFKNLQLAEDFADSWQDY